MSSIWVWVIHTNYYHQRLTPLEPDLMHLIFTLLFSYSDSDSDKYLSGFHHITYPFLVDSTDISIVGAPDIFFF